MNFNDKLIISSDISLFNRKNWGNFKKKILFGPKFIKINFSQISSEISKKSFWEKIVDHKFAITKPLSDSQISQ